MSRLVCILIALAACAEPADTDDAQAEAAPQQAAGKADTSTFAGVYASHATSFHAGDVPALELRTDGRYVRARCYHASCALRLPETDDFDTYTSSSGKTYVRFWTFTVARDANGELAETPAIADVYEIRASSTTIHLRKSYTSTWHVLYKSTDQTLCGRSGGTWSTEGCACAGEFIAGAGGCIKSPGASEDGCDTSDGLWTDDDATLIGSYCRCGAGRFVNDSGACASI